MASKPETKKADNDIRIGMNSRPRNVIKYATSIFKEKNLKELKFSAVGGSIGRLIEIVEVIKVLIPGLYQQNKITTVTYQTVDSGDTVLRQRLYPKLEVILTKDEPQSPTTKEGFQGQLDENIREKLQKIMDQRRERIEKERGEGRRPPRRGGRFGDRREGGFRRGGFRGGFRGRRGGFRGGRRGGFGGPRRGFGGPRRGFRGGFRNDRRGGFGGQRRGPRPIGRGGN